MNIRTEYKPNFQLSKVARRIRNGTMSWIPQSRSKPGLELALIFSLRLCMNPPFHRFICNNE
jgi:hypothetical protein